MPPESGLAQDSGRRQRASRLLNHQGPPGRPRPRSDRLARSPAPRRAAWWQLRTRRSISATSSASLIFAACSTVTGSPTSTHKAGKLGNHWRLGNASKAPSTATGSNGTLARRANKVKPGLKAATRPSLDRVPSGKISTISPAFKRRSVSFQPDAPPPSRSIGIASRKSIN